MNKKIYGAAKLDVTRFDTEDVIVTSSGGSTEDVIEDQGTW